MSSIPSDTVAAPEIEVFWRPGCPFCARLRVLLLIHRVKATWRNIWQDDQARVFVQAANGGYETVPTVRIGHDVLTNPTWPELAPLVGLNRL